MNAGKLLLACSIFAASAAQAQIYKCKDENGRLLLSDKPCASGALLQRKATTEEIAQDDLRAFEANLNKQERRNREASREASKQMESARSQQYAPPNAASQHQSYEERLAQRNAGVKSILAPSKVPSGRPAPNPPPTPAPTTFTNCGGGFCTDNYGGTYHQVSQDFMTGPNGQACHRSGTVWNCN